MTRQQNLDEYTVYEQPCPYTYKTLRRKVEWILQRHQSAVDDNLALKKLYKQYWGDTYTLEDSITRTRRQLIKEGLFRKSAKAAYESRQQAMQMARKFTDTTNSSTGASPSASW